VRARFTKAASLATGREKWVDQSSLRTIQGPVSQSSCRESPYLLQESLDS
jgi:hypothetical protein